VGLCDLGNLLFEHDPFDIDSLCLELILGLGLKFNAPPELTTVRAAHDYLFEVSAAFGNGVVAEI
jgi:hypothetical protein